jgi:hypothetical protein
MEIEMGDIERAVLAAEHHGGIGGVKDQTIVSSALHLVQPHTDAGQERTRLWRGFEMTLSHFPGAEPDYMTSRQLI